MDSITLLPPFSRSEELVKDEERFQNVDATKVALDLIEHHLNTPDLNGLKSLLSFVAKNTGDHIDPLHVHTNVKGRKVQLVEDPKLHLVWSRDVVWIKPIPSPILNYGFWCQELLGEPLDIEPEGWSKDNVSPLCRQTLGYLRSYSFLVCSATDFRLAQQLHLVPSNITFAEFNNVFSRLRKLHDDFVAFRYHWGQFRLNRLNWAVRVNSILECNPSKLHLYYQESYWSANQHLRRFGAPLLFLFAAFQLTLSSMQVILAALGESTPSSFSNASYVFSVSCIIGIASLIGFLFAGIVIMLLLQLQFAIRTKKT